MNNPRCSGGSCTGLPPYISDRAITSVRPYGSSAGGVEWVKARSFRSCLSCWATAISASSMRMRCAGAGRPRGGRRKTRSFGRWSAQHQDTRRRLRRSQARGINASSGTSSPALCSSFRRDGFLSPRVQGKGIRTNRIASRATAIDFRLTALARLERDKKGGQALPKPAKPDPNRLK